MNIAGSSKALRTIWHKKKQVGTSWTDCRQWYASFGRESFTADELMELVRCLDKLQDETEVTREQPIT